MKEGGKMNDTHEKESEAVMGEHGAEKDARLTEDQARRSETELMVGRLARLARLGGLSADQRIGVCLAQKVLEDRRAELRARRTIPPGSGDTDAGRAGE
jgi:hypothetical protein